MTRLICFSAAYEVVENDANATIAKANAATARIVVLI
jgi:hypothetical protein